MLTVISDCSRQALTEVYFWLPSKDRLNSTKIGVVIPDIYFSALDGKFASLVFPTAIDIDQQLGEILQIDRRFAAQVKDFSVRFFARCRQQECVNHVIDKSKIALLVTPPDFEGSPLDNQADPFTEKSLSCIDYSHSRTICIGQAQGTCPYTVYVIVKDVIPLTCHLVYSVNIDRPKKMFFIDRQIIGLSINLSCAGINDFDGWVVFAAGFEDGKLGTAIYLQVGVGIIHRVQVARLAGEVEEVVLPLY